MIKTNTFYKVKKAVNGMPTPGGYFFVLKYDWTPAGDGKVTFVITDSEKEEYPINEKGAFTISEEHFLRMTEV